MAEASNSCCGGSCTPKKKVLVYACSGAANVAEIADTVARQLMTEDAGQMFCLAGLGAGIPNMVQTARDADLNLVIDGCPLDCARIIFQKHGLTNVAFVRVTDHGITKAKGVPITENQVQQILGEAKKALAQA